MRLLAQLAVVGVRHADEALAKRVVIRAHERIIARHARKVNVVIEQHDVANLKVAVNAASSVGQDDGVNTECPHDADWERHLL